MLLRAGLTSLIVFYFAVILKYNKSYFEGYKQIAKANNSHAEELVRKSLHTCFQNLQLKVNSLALYLASINRRDTMIN
jgi:hypothetical protein